MNKTAKQIALLLLIGLIIIAVFQLSQSGSDKKVLSYSDFMLKVAAKDISRVSIENNKKITGYYRVTKVEDIKQPGIKSLVKRENPDFETIIPYEDPELVKTLIANDVKVEGKDDEDSFLLKGVLNFLPWLLFFGFIWFIMIRQIQSTGNKALSFGKSRAKLNPETKRKVTFLDVAGVDEAKEELNEVVEFLKEPKKFINIGAKIPTGVLLVGPPGTGKTLLARAIAGEAGVPFFSISGSDFVEMFVGVGASRVRDLFDQGKKSAPCIIFIDEIDAVGRLRGAGLGGGHDEREQTLNQLLVEMDGFETNEGVIIIAATNRPDVLDPALLRPGRFDRQVVVDIPDIKGREKILAVHTKKIPLSREVDLKIIARGTPGFTGADLANLVNESALLAARRSKKRVTMLEMEDAKDKVLMGPERRSILISDKGKGDNGVPRSRPCHPGHPDRLRPRAQGHHHPAGEGAGRNHAAAPGRPQALFPAALAQYDNHTLRRAPHRGAQVQAGNHRLKQRPRARIRYRPQDGMRMGHEREARSHNVRETERADFPRQGDFAAPRLQRTNGENDRRRGQCHHRCMQAQRAEAS